MPDGNKQNCFFPIEVWGQQYASFLQIYRAAPQKPNVSFGGFKSRMARFHKLHGFLDSDAVNISLYDRPHAYSGGGVIYEILQLSTGRRYIGITDCPASRWKQHQDAVSNPVCRLHVEMKKAGQDDFEFRVLISGRFSRDVMKRLEKALIRAEQTVWPSGLNSRKA